MKIVTQEMVGGESASVEQSVADFVNREMLGRDPLHPRAYAVANAIGRLLEVLLRNRLISDTDFHFVIEDDRYLFNPTYKIVNDDIPTKETE